MAFALHQQGNLAEAEKIYADILQRMPEHFGALNLLGAIACQKGAYEPAIQLISKAVSINPNVAAAHSNLGVALKELKRPEEALTSFDKAVTLKPDYAEAHYNRGLVLRQLGRLEEALVSYDRAIALNAECDAFYDRGNILRELGRYEEALASYDKAIAANPNYVDTYSNRGNVLKELHRPREALGSYDKAIALKPDSRDLFNRGLVLQELRRTEEALASFERSVALKPDYAEAHYNCGVALKELGRIGEAIVSYDRAIALKSDFSEAYNNRGLALTELGRFDEAVASCDKALALRPDLAEAHLNRGLVLFELDRLEESLASCDKAIALDPRLSRARNNKGSALNALGRLDEAYAAFLKAVQIDPTNTEAYLSLAESKKFLADDPHIAAMEKLAASEQLSISNRINLDFALGKAYANLKDHRRSFNHLLAANAGKRAKISYDEERQFKFFDAIEATFTKQLIAAKSGGGDPSPQPIFILGMPRSGTTLVEQILASHPMVHGAGELETLSEVARILLQPDGSTIHPENFAALGRSGFAEIAARYLDAVNKRAPGAERVTDKMPSNFFFVGLIHLALPNAKIIHTTRDPVDTCVSCFSKLFTHGQNFAYDLGELGRYYKRYERLMAHWRGVLPPNRVLEVRYEDVVADLETEVRQILSYCELPWDERCLSFHETKRPVKTASVMQVRQPIYKNAVGRWRNYEEFLGPLLTALSISPAKEEA